MLFNIFIPVLNFVLFIYTVYIIYYYRYLNIFSCYMRSVLYRVKPNPQEVAAINRDVLENMVQLKRCLNMKKLQDNPETLVEANDNFAAEFGQES